MLRCANEALIVRFGSCKFGEDCAYTHIKYRSENNIEKLVKEIKHLKRKVDETVTEKAVNDLEQKIEKLKIDENYLNIQSEKKELRLQILE